MTLLKNGDRGSAVTTLQKALQANGYSLSIDGIFGAGTEAIVKEFQSKEGLSVDGIVGNNTYAALGVREDKTIYYPVSGSIDTVIDISHHQGTIDIQKVKADGIQVILHKATEGNSFVDSKYTENREKASSVDLFWGAYHFGTGASSGTEQADHFYNTIKDSTPTVLVLDLEGNPSGEDMTFEQAKEFITRIHELTGIYPGLYSGSTITQMLDGTPDPLLSKCWLWKARYNDYVTIDSNWIDWTMWQYSDGTHGPNPQPVDGISTAVDRDLFNGTTQELTAFWIKNAYQVLLNSENCPA